MAGLLPEPSLPHRLDLSHTPAPARIEFSPRRALAVLVAVVALASPGFGRTLAVDTDGDGRLEALNADPTADRGFTVAPAEGSRTPGSAAASAVRLAVCDWNADGASDVIVARAGTPVALWTNDGHGGFSRDEEFGAQVPSSARGMVFADLANSPYPGFACWTDSLTIAVARRPGPRAYELAYFTVPQRGPLALRDANGDGRIDVVVGRSVRLQTAEGWRNRWVPVDRFPATRTARLRLVGPEGNPEAIGARVILRTPAGAQHHWLHQATNGPLALALPRDGAGLMVRWPDGGWSIVATLPPGDVTIRADIPAVYIESHWSNDLVGSHLRWRFDAPVPVGGRALWTVVRTGRVAAPDPVRFDEAGRVAEWTTTPPLAPGERCVLAYAGRPVDEWVSESAATVVMPWPIARDTLLGVRGIAIADGSGDGLADYLVATDEPDRAMLRAFPLPRGVAGAGESATVDPDDLGHIAWHRIVSAAQQEGMPAGVRWVGDAAPLGLDGWVLRAVDATGDGRLDILALSPDGVVALYVGTDGRTAGFHLAGGAARVGPVGPGEPASIVLGNPGDGEIAIDELRADGIALDGTPLPLRIAPGGRATVSVRVPAGRHDDYAAAVTAVGAALDGGSTVLPVIVTIGVPANAPPIEIAVDLGTVQRDSVASARTRIPWVRFPSPDGATIRYTGPEGALDISLANLDADTVGAEIAFRPRAIGPLRFAYPLRRGAIVFRATVIDTVPPPRPRPRGIVHGDTVEIRWAPDGIGDIDHYAVARLDGDRSGERRIGLDSLWRETELGEGRAYRWVVYAVDAAGNRSSSDTLLFRIPDRSPPRVTLIEPADGATEVDVRRPLVLQVADSLSGIRGDTVTLSIDEAIVPRESYAVEGRARRLRIVYRPGAWPLGRTVRVSIVAADSAEPANVAHWSARFATIGDTIVPEVRWVGPPPALGRGGTVRATVEMPPDRRLVKATLIMRAAGSDRERAIAGAISDRQVAVDVPPAAAPAGGAFYRWIIETDRRTYRLPDGWRAWSLPTPADGLVWPRSGERGRGRALLAAPIVAGRGDALSSGSRAVLAGSGPRIELAEFDAVRQRWRTGEDVGPLAIGRALAVSWRVSAPVVQTQPGRTVPLDSALAIVLQPRWNLIGQPFPYAVSWADVLAANPGSQVSGPWVERRGLRLGETWNAWEGAWVYLAASRPATLVIPPRDAPPAEPDRSDRLARTTIPVPLRLVGWPEGRSFLLAMTVDGGDEAIADLAVGWNDAARDGWDRFDSPSPPTLDSAFAARVLHSDWDEHPGPYAIDIRRPARGHVWRLSVATAGSPDATLRLRFLVPPPPGTAVDVIDLMTRDSVRVDRATMSLRIRDAARFPVRELIVIAGDASYRRTLPREEVLAPSELILYRNSPNPFNGATTISFSVPPGSEAGRARLVIYNAIGQHVRVLHDGPVAAGMHTYTWDARNDHGNALSSGIYFCELTYGSERRLQRMIYLR